MNFTNGSKVSSIKDTQPINKLMLSTAYCVIGSVFLSLMSQLSLPLPFTPVPLTLQTLALFLLVIAQGKVKSSISVILYLVQASAGLPVLAGGLVNPLWILSPTAGYLVGFLAFTLTAGYLLEMKKNPGMLWTGLSLVCGQTAVYTLGTVYLANFIGIAKAVELGVTPFLLGAAIKLLCATCFSKPINYISEQV
ncbi:MAG: biotin transporter BioY [Chlamydiota bacterium]|nr:biotin transporter BioY [Chlamydiota bacterium]